jgi:hypothetical protein
VGPRGRAAGRVGAVHGGNTSPGAEGSQDDGGTVAEKVRAASEVYGRIRLHDLYPGGGASGRGRRRSTVVLPNRSTSRSRPRRPAIWTTGPRVADLQAALGIADADGYYGRVTATKVAAAGAQHGTSTPTMATSRPLELIRTRTAPRRRSSRAGCCTSATRAGWSAGCSAG